MKTWNDFLEHRVGMKSPMTKRAQELLISKLSKHRDEGFDPTTLLETAIIKTWKSVYPSGNGKTKKTRIPSDQTRFAP